ncbi:YdcF family protein [Priestia megaterium]|nr:YdcF family protein [Priestia megaterium]
MKRKIVMLIFFVIVIYVCVISYFMYEAANQQAPRNADYVMVLGAKVNGTEMSLSLYERTVTALHYLEDNPDTKAILTGGQGNDEDITEAEAMYQFLTAKGVSSDRLIKEEQSTSTYENFLYTKQLVDITNKDIVLISNDFHLFRASLIAKRQGFHVSPLAAKTPNAVKLQTYSREYAAILKTWLLDK